MWSRQQASNLLLNAGNVALFLLSYACSAFATSQIVKERSACAGRNAGAARKRIRFRDKAGTPPGIRTRITAFLRRVRMPFRQRGTKKQKARGPCGATRAFRMNASDLAASHLLRARCTRERITERVRDRLAPRDAFALYLWLSIHAKHFSPHYVLDTSAFQ
jgi:hypothetical protein